MIESVEITNDLDETILMELGSPASSGLLIYAIRGLGPAKSDLFINEIAAMDGGIYNAGRTNTRNIVFSLRFPGFPTVEHSRALTYKYFPLKKRIKILVNTTEKSVFTYGYVETNVPDIWQKAAGCTISVICPDPWFYDTDLGLTIFGAITGLFEFPWSNESITLPLVEFSEIVTETVKYVYYKGEVPVGIVLHIHANGPANDVVIADIDSNLIEIDSAKLIEITGSDIVLYDNIYISTVKGDKYAKLVRSTVEYDILNALGEDPYWFQIDKGDNMFAYTADSGLLNLAFQVFYNIGYQGV